MKQRVGIPKWNNDYTINYIIFINVIVIKA